MIELYAARTPNGRKATIMLEEAGLPYRLHVLDLSAGEQHTPAFRKLNPNGKIPVIVDTATGQTISESGAILIYLAEKAGALLPADPAARMAVLQWLFFQVGGIGPMAGQYNHFRRHEPRDDYALERYRDEVRRLLGVMNDALQDRNFIAGNYSIADVALVPWLRALQRWDLSLMAYPHVSAWYQRVMARPAVGRGFAVLDTPVRSKSARAAPDLDEDIRIAQWAGDGLHVTPPDRLNKKIHQTRDGAARTTRREVPAEKSS